MNNHTQTARNVIIDEAKSLNKLADNVPADFAACVDHILHTDGRVILVGMGKSGHIAKKIAASLASTGTPSFFIHPGEASHGDLGMITEADTVIMLSNSGETKELLDTIDYCSRFNIKMAGITMNGDSTLGKHVDYKLIIPVSEEISEIDSPTNSALMMLSLGHALVVCLHQARGFTKEQFRNFHPGGKIGANLTRVEDLMYVGDKIPLVSREDSFNQIILRITEKSLGCAIVTTGEGAIEGIITDGDLRRHINDEGLHKFSATKLMTKNPITVSPEDLASEALYIMNQKSITSLPVSSGGVIIGVIHIHDILRIGVS